MDIKKLFRGITLVLFLALAIPVIIAKNVRDADSSMNTKYIFGDWFAQIDIPQGEMTFLMEMNILDTKNCIIKCTWSGPYPTKEESGKAKWKLDGNKLVITFPNEEELITTDNVFDMENIYEISLTKDRLVILNSPQFRNVDLNFGLGYENRGFAKIIFPDDD